MSVGLGDTMSNEKQSDIGFYSLIQSTFWTRGMRRLSANAKLLMLYLLTNHHRNILGFYVISKGYMISDTRMSSDDFEAGFQELRSKGSIDYDEENEILLIKKFLKYNPIVNPNQVKHAIKRLNDLPDSPLWAKFLQYLPDVNLSATVTQTLIETVRQRVTVTVPETLTKTVTPTPQEGLPGETENDPQNDPSVPGGLLGGGKNSKERNAREAPPRQGCETVTQTVPVTVTETSTQYSVLSKEKEIKESPQSSAPGGPSEHVERSEAVPEKKAIPNVGQPHEGETPEKSAEKPVGYPPEFEQFWNVYPRKAEKKPAYRAWLAEVRKKEPLEDLLRAARNYAARCAQEKTEERFIKHAATFLHDMRWKDYLGAMAAGGDLTPEEKKALRAKYTDRERRCDDKAMLLEYRRILRERGVE